MVMLGLYVFCRYQLPWFAGWFGMVVMLGVYVVCKRQLPRFAGGLAGW
jgi:hypothetical protein